MAEVYINENSGPIISDEDITDCRYMPYDTTTKKIKNAKLASQAIPVATASPADISDDTVPSTAGTYQDITGGGVTITTEAPSSTLIITYSGRVIDGGTKNLQAGEEVIAQVTVDDTPVDPQGIKLADDQKVDYQVGFTVYKTGVAAGTHTVKVKATTTATDSVVGFEDQVLTVIALPA